MMWGILKLVSGAFILAVLCIAIQGCQGPNASKAPANAESEHLLSDAQRDVNAPSGAAPPDLPTPGASGEPTSATSGRSAEPLARIRQIVETGQTRAPSCREWWGKAAPDFTLRDVEGKTHTLSTCRSRTVMVVLWASWSGPCRMEIPYLKELRNALTRDDLAILAISNESPLTLEQFVREQRLNYTVLSNPGTLPAPFATVRCIPTTFFINYEGRIETVAEGAMGAAEAKVIAEILAAPP